MLQSIASFFLLALYCLLCSDFFAGRPAAALTIYRIGGEQLPAPVLDAPFDFVQLSWREVDASRHGSTHQLTVLPEHIAPQRLDPNINLTSQLAAIGGKIQHLNWAGWQKPTNEDALIFDADTSTAYLGDGRFSRSVGDPPQKNWLFDFGGDFFIERIRFFPRQRFLSDRFIEHFIIGIRDSDPLKEGSRAFVVGQVRVGSRPLDFDIVYDIDENSAPVIDLELPPVPISQLLFHGFKNNRGIWEIAEFQIFGSGFAPSASYVSNVIELGGVASLGTLSWSGQQDPGARIELRMRSGDDDDPNTYWRFTFNGDTQSRFDSDGKPLDRQSHRRLESGERAGITHDTEHWQFWSPPFAWASGSSPMAGSKSRQFVQFKVDISSTKEASGRLDYLQFSASTPPVAREALGEIVPIATTPGTVTSFTYKLKPRLDQADLGFDTIAIDTPVQPVGVDSVRISGQSVAFDLARMDERGFAVRIPRIDFQRTQELIEVVFRAEIFEFATIFSGRLFDSQRPHEVPHTVSPGDADERVDSDALQVDLKHLEQQALRSLRLIPAIFTPNGDGINDIVHIEYELLNLTEAVAVQVLLYDLSGRFLGQVYRGEAASGRFSTTWTGRDQNGALLAPGLYILRLKVDADKGEESRGRVVSLLY